MQFLGNKQTQKDSKGQNGTQRAAGTNGVSSTAGVSATQKAGTALKLFPQPQGTSRVVASGGVTAATSSTSSTSSSTFNVAKSSNGNTLSQVGGTTATETISTQAQPEGPDYVSVFRDPQKEAEYQAKEFVDWDRQRTGPRGVEAFLQMISQQFPGIEAECAEQDIHNISLADINDAMIVFAQKNKVDNLRWCIEMGADVGFIDDKKSNVLTIAASKGSNEALEYLLSEIGLNVSRRNANGYTALTSASASGKESTIALLIHHGSWLIETDTGDRNLFHVLIRKGHLDIAKKFLSKFTDMNTSIINERVDYQQINTSNETILGAAIYQLLLIQANLPPNSSNDEIKKATGPVIDFCKFLKNITGLPYAAVTVYNNRRSLMPIHVYIDIKEEAEAKIFISQLAHADNDFLKEILSAPQNFINHDDFIKFKRIYTDIERHQTTCSVHKSPAYK